MNRVTTTIFLAGLAAALQTASAANAPSQHLNFNGFFAGMSKAAAKQMGVTSCRYGSGIGETSDSIYCDIPEPLRKLGPIVASKAVLEFRINHRDMAERIHLTFAASEGQTKAVLTSTYGQPSWHEDSPTRDIWAKGAETLDIEFMRSTSQRAYVSFDYDARLGQARASAGKNAAKRKKDLANF
jgi:hypothetical protein